MISPSRLSSLRRSRGRGITINNSVGVEDSCIGIRSSSIIDRRSSRLFSKTPFEKTIITKRMAKSTDSIGDDGVATYSNIIINHGDDDDNDDIDNVVKIPKSFRGVFVGSGSDGMSDPRIAKTILDLVPQNKKNTTSSSSSLEKTDTSSSRTNHKVHVAYLGTATYDFPQFATRQTQCFKDLGCQVEMLDLAHHHHHRRRHRHHNNNKDRSSSTTDTKDADADADAEEKEEEEQDAKNPNKTLTEYARHVLERADIIVVGGGNTLYAIDRWKELHVDKLLRDAMDRGVVLTGGSAGAICWFDGGHSDSCDPNSFYTPMMKKFGNTHDADGDNGGGGGGGRKDDLPPPDESAIADDDDDAANKDWKYIRVPCLGFIPGLCCPHHDRVQSNGVLRADDFDEMLLRNYNYQKDNSKTQHSSSSELGIAIDHWAALVCCGEDDSYQVISLEGKKGSVLYNNEEGGDGNDDGDVDETDATLAAPSAAATFSRDADGVPGIWLKDVQDGKVRRQVLPKSGKLSQILRRRPRRSSSSITEGIDKEAIEECRRLNQPWVDN